MPSVSIILFRKLAEVMRQGYILTVGLRLCEESVHYVAFCFMRSLLDRIDCFALKGFLFQIVEAIYVLLFVLRIFLVVAWVRQSLVLCDWEVVRGVGVTCGPTIFDDALTSVGLVVVAA